jgi:hypothetical protein
MVGQSLEISITAALACTHCSAIYRRLKSVLQQVFPALSPALDLNLGRNISP